jgi:hypothetical protein
MRCVMTFYPWLSAKGYEDIVFKENMYKTSIFHTFFGDKNVLFNHRCISEYIKK